MSGAGRRRIGLALAALLLGTATATTVSAQEVRVRAMVDRTRIAQGDELVLSIEIAAASFEQVSPPDLSRLEDFDIVGGPNVSSRFQWINGRTSSTRTYSYVLRPRTTGSLRIPALGMLIQGRTYHTDAIDIGVVPGSARGGAPAPPAGPAPGAASPEPSPGAVAAAGGPDVLVRAEVETRTAWVGQQVTVRFVLDTQTEILNLALKDQPTFPGFWAEEIKVPDNLDARRVQRGGRTWIEYTLMKKALFPTASGTLTIPGVNYQIQVRRRSADPIESFFFTPTETITRRTDPVTVTVQPLPSPRPPDFTGAVGRFNLSVSADRKDARVNDAVGVKLKLTGEGNLNAINAVPLTLPADFKQYAPKVTSTTSIQDDRLRGEKVWDYVLIPLAPGALAIPPVSFSFFDPVARAYRTVASPPIPILVARAEGGAAGPLPAVAQSDVRALRQDIHYIKQARGGALRDRSRFFYRSPWFIALLILPIAVDAGIVVAVRRRDLHPDLARMRRGRRAYGATRRRLREARRRMSPSVARAFYASVASALTEYLAAKYDTAAAGLTHDRIEELLAGRGVPEDQRAAFHRCLESCDFARFAPSSTGVGEMQRTLQAAEDVVHKLERTLSA